MIEKSKESQLQSITEFAQELKSLKALLLTRGALASGPSTPVLPPKPTIPRVAARGVRGSGERHEVRLGARCAFACACARRVAGVGVCAEWEGQGGGRGAFACASCAGSRWFVELVVVGKMLAISGERIYGGRICWGAYLFRFACCIRTTVILNFTRIEVRGPSPTSKVRKYEFLKLH